jgi:hypothetical protein
MQAMVSPSKLHDGQPPGCGDSTGPTGQVKLIYDVTCWITDRPQIRAFGHLQKIAEFRQLPSQERKTKLCWITNRQLAGFADQRRHDVTKPSAYPHSLFSVRTFIYSTSGHGASLRDYASRSGSPVQPSQSDRSVLSSRRVLVPLEPTCHDWSNVVSLMNLLGSREFPVQFPPEFLTLSQSLRLLPSKRSGEPPHCRA